MKQCGTEKALPRCSELYWCHNYKGRLYSYEETLRLIENFYGDSTPWLVIGVKMVTLALERFNIDTPFDVVCETRECLPDAVQILTPCTVGNGKLKINDMGRYAITFYDKISGRGIRVSVNSDRLKLWEEYYNWFFGVKLYRDLDYDQLMSDMRSAGDTVLHCSEIELIV